MRSHLFPCIFICSVYACHTSRDFLSDKSFYQLPNGENRYKPNKCDTLFAVGQLQKKPVALLKCTDPETEFKHYIHPFFENSRFQLIRITHIFSETNNKGELTSISINQGNSYLVDKKDYTTKKIAGIRSEMLDIEITGNEVQFRPQFIIFPVNALKFKEELKEKYKQNRLTERQKQLYENVEENDNPILIIGKTKK